MNHLTDDLLNKIIDGEASVAESNFTAGHVPTCASCAEKLEAMKKVHANLLALKEESPSVNFTAVLMGKLERSLKRKKQQKYFVSFIFALFIILILTSLGYLISISQFSLSFSAESGKYISEYVNRYSSVADDLHKLISGRNLTMIGSVLSMGIIISAYLFYSNHKTFKNSLK